MVLDHNLNPDKYTKGQLEANRDDAHAAYDADNVGAAYAYSAADAAALATATYDAGYWLNGYFKMTGENKQDYIDAINKDK
tara:strand:- start:108 stop:350 length:243 start_codon:yes stop_codon:yes gene_type:complete